MFRYSSGIFFLYLALSYAIYEGSSSDFDDEDFEQEEVLGDDHEDELYGFEDDQMGDQEYYEGYGDGSDDFDNEVQAAHLNNGRSSGGSSQYNDPLAVRSSKKGSSGFGQDSVL